MTGTLYVVATPIGNLEDLTFRALRVLKEVDLIAAEDTRRTSKLLAHYEIRKSTVSLREHNEVRETPRLLHRLANGESVALVTDAGTPGISDPGARLVRAARDRGLPVVPVPGPSAVTAALSVAGVAGDEFVFMAFPPRGGAARATWLERLQGESRAVVFFEAPHRIVATIGQITEIIGSRRIIVFREITKFHESSVNIDVAAAESALVNARGEFVVVVDQADKALNDSPDPAIAADLFGRLTDRAELEPDVACRMIAAFLGSDERIVRKIIKQARILANRQNQRSP